MQRAGKGAFHSQLPALTQALILAVFYTSFMSLFVNDYTHYAFLSASSCLPSATLYYSLSLSLSRGLRQFLLPRLLLPNGTNERTDESPHNKVLRRKLKHSLLPPSLCLLISRRLLIHISLALTFSIMVLSIIAFLTLNFTSI
jgi:hypothetical protein